MTELNKTIIRYLVDAFGLKTRICDAREIRGLKGNGTELLFDICQTLGANTYLSGAFGKEYLDEALFVNHGIEVTFQEFSHPEYKQVFEPFISGMAAIDLIFNYGKGSLQILRGEEGG